MQKYSKLFKEQDAKKKDLIHLNTLLLKYEETPLELMEKTINRNL